MVSSIRLGRHRELTQVNHPNHANADHAQQARNKWGDVLTVYHYVAVPATTRQAIAITLGRRNEETGKLEYVKHFNERLLSPDYAHSWPSEAGVIVADPTGVIYGAGNNDNCKRPTIIALNDGSFMVAWARFDNSSKASARLEVAQVTCRDPKTGKHEQMAIRRPTAVTGYPVANFDARAVEAFPTACAYGINSAVIIWGDTTEYTATVGPDGYHTLSRLRRTQLHWNKDPDAADNGPSGSGWRESAATDIVTGVGGDYYATLPIDNSMLPECAFGPCGSLFVAYDEYQRNGHGSWVADQGFLRIKRVEGPYSATPWTNISADAVNIQHTTVTHQLRRVQLAVGMRDSEMGYLATSKLYLTIGRLFTGGVNGNYSAMIEFDRQGSVGGGVTALRPFGDNDGLGIGRPHAVAGPKDFVGFIGDPVSQGSLNKRLAIGYNGADAAAAAAAQEFFRDFGLYSPSRPHAVCDYVNDDVVLGITFEAFLTAADTSATVWYMEGALAL